MLNILKSLIKLCKKTQKRTIKLSSLPLAISEPHQISKVQSKKVREKTQKEKARRNKRISLFAGIKRPPKFPKLTLEHSIFPQKKVKMQTVQTTKNTTKVTKIVHSQQKEMPFKIQSTLPQSLPHKESKQLKMTDYWLSELKMRSNFQKSNKTIKVSKGREISVLNR